MMNMPQNRTATTKLILVGASVVMGFAILGIWASALGFRMKISDALTKAARVRPVQFTTDDAQAARTRLEKLARPAGAENVESEEKKDEKSGEEGKGRRSREGQGGGNHGTLSEEFASLLEKRPLFGAPPKSGPPQANVQGILGDSALINGDWIKIGEEKKGIKLLETLPDKVVVEIEGQRKEASVWQGLPDKPMPPSPQALMASNSSSGGRSLNARERSQMMKTERQSGGSGSSLRDSLRARSRRDSIGAYRDMSRSSERGSGAVPGMGVVPPGAAAGQNEKIQKQLQKQLEKSMKSGGMGANGALPGGAPGSLPDGLRNKKIKSPDGSNQPGGMGNASANIPKLPKSIRPPVIPGSVPSPRGPSGGMPGERSMKKPRDGSPSSRGSSLDPSRTKGSSSDANRGERSNRLRKARDIYRNGAGQ